MKKSARWCLAGLKKSALAADGYGVPLMGAGLGGVVLGTRNPRQCVEDLSDRQCVEDLSHASPLTNDSGPDLIVCQDDRDFLSRSPDMVDL
eukprot:4361250-Amphidinium_carterae.1